jgi:hypothetical protein
MPCTLTQPQVLNIVITFLSGELGRSDITAATSLGPAGLGIDPDLLVSYVNPIGGVVGQTQCCYIKNLASPDIQGCGTVTTLATLIFNNLGCK